MMFVTLIEIPQETTTEATRLIKKPRIPKGVRVLQSLATFGKPDAIIIFEADSEELAAEFVVQFRDMTDSTTLLAMPMELVKWTR